MENISFTDMLLGVEMTGEADYYRNMQQMPLGQEVWLPKNKSV